MNFKFLVIYLVLTLGFSSCILVEDAISDKSTTKGNLESKIQDSVEVYVKKNFPDTKYYKYGFSQLIIHKPLELIQLDSLKQLKENQGSTANLEAQITTLEQDIKKDKIGYWFELDHVFRIKESSSDSVELFESKFFLNDSLRVINSKLLRYNHLSKSEENSYGDFFYEHPIFKAADYYQSQQLSHNFYNYFKLELEKRSGVKNKSEFLTHIIWLCQKIKVKGEFNQDEVLRDLTQQNFIENPKIESYKSIEFSNLRQINEDDKLKNYYFFHKFSHLTDGNVIENAVYVSFSPYYEIEDIFQLEKPFEQYFNEETSQD
ncbi:MAG: hypothetical protein ACWA41_03985 [Putridiphycobacter sp.]